MSWDSELPGHTCPAIDRAIRRVENNAETVYDVDGDKLGTEHVPVELVIAEFESLRRENDALRTIATERMERIEELHKAMDRATDALGEAR